MAVIPHLAITSKIGKPSIAHPFDKITDSTVVPKIMTGSTLA